ncbi:translational GTPase TypA [Candidatus Dependentiae bacterium]|nr:translational GTPase TypA [Candidatus Dependentiae bacterium]
MNLVQKDELRNIAIIAHVDHGKTTLIDQMLSQSGTLDEKNRIDRVMDSNDLEKERGITILAKNTSISLPNAKINIVDTPGHMDFGGEVERTLQMVEGFLLLVDAAEGPLPGTRFVLQKALALNLKPLVFINKIDRKDADIKRVESEINDLFLDVATDESQLDFPILYGSSKLGFASTDPLIKSGNINPIFDAILNHVPSPKSKSDFLQLLITNLDYSDYMGRIGIGRIFSGEIKIGDQVICCKDRQQSPSMRVTKLYKFEGVTKKEVGYAKYGDIIAITGFENEITIGTTICNHEKPFPLKYVAIDEPTLSVNISVNNSPFSGREGKLLTSRQIRERLFKELKTNVALRVEETNSADTFKVSGRGQLHIGILVENMRREGFEVAVSAPEVIYKEINGQKCEPYEILTINIDSQYQGIVMENLGSRKAELKNMEPYGENKIKMEFIIPARGLIGFRSQFVTNTRGTGLINHRFAEYKPYAGQIQGRVNGSMISMENGIVTAYALDGLQPRGMLFVYPTTETYQGMIIGEHNRENDIDVNPTRKKKLTNMRAAGSDDSVKLAPPKQMSLEESLEWINNDELIEVTPKSIRLRKKFLKAVDRKRNKS